MSSFKEIGRTIGKNIQQVREIVVNPIPYLQELPQIMEDEFGQERGRKWLLRGVIALLTPPAIASAGIITDVSLLTVLGLISTGIEFSSIGLTWLDMGKELSQSIVESRQSRMQPRLPGF